MEIIDGTWTDQPEEAASSPRLASGRDDGIVWEVRHRAGTFYVSIGNLVGSQTLRCRDALVAFAVLNTITNRPKGSKPQPPPAGATLMENR